MTEPQINRINAPLKPLEKIIMFLKKAYNLTVKPKYMTPYDVIEFSKGLHCFEVRQTFDYKLIYFWGYIESFYFEGEKLYKTKEQCMKDVCEEHFMKQLAYVDKLPATQSAATP